MKTIVNMEASVKSKLLNKARDENKPFSEILQYYGIERLLYRFSRSKYREKVILKGALLLVAWNSPKYRMTRDIDFLGKTKNDLNEIILIVKDVCSQKVENDGIRYDSEQVNGQEIMESNEYLGIRLKVPGYLGKARFIVQLDFGFGDKVYPKPTNLEYPVLIEGMPKPKLIGYLKETVIAEKYHAIVHHGAMNSRMKDYYDLWLLFSLYSFEKKELLKAINSTFKWRDTKLTDNPIGLSDEFAKTEEKKNQWKMFRKNMRLENAPEDFSEVIRTVHKFISAVIKK